MFSGKQQRQMGLQTLGKREILQYNGLCLDVFEKAEEAMEYLKQFLFVCSYWVSNNWDSSFLFFENTKVVGSHEKCRSDSFMK
jgi:hypothetical protein